MNEATVYRVQRDDGSGPYRGCELDYAAIHDNSDVAAFHPAPWEDGIEPSESDYFAFASLDDLCAWFNERERAFLAQRGFAVAVYRVATHLVRRGQCQCVFCKSQATLERVEALA